MKLSGQALDRRGCASPHAVARIETGYAMAALLVALSVMAVLMTVAMPVWKQLNQREKEEELVFRGQQYVRAIGLFQRRTGPGVLPPNLDVLVNQHFLRRKYKDPVTGEDFLLIPGAVAAGAQAQVQAAQSASQSAGLPNRSSQTSSPGLSGSSASSAASAGYVTQGGPLGSNVPGGITGVVSKSTDVSLRQYNGRGHYNEWEFRYTAPPQPANNGGPNGRGGQPQPQGGVGGIGGVNGRGGLDGRGGPADGRGRGPADGRGGPGVPPPAGGRGPGGAVTTGPNGPVFNGPNGPVTLPPPTGRR
jgi:type II secretory pathway pseudopilin PulG